MKTNILSSNELVDALQKAGCLEDLEKANSMEEICACFRHYGVDISEEEASAYVKGVATNICENRELDENELETISGGNYAMLGEAIVTGIEYTIKLRKYAFDLGRKWAKWMGW